MKHVIFLTLNIISIYVLVLQFSFLISSLKLTLGFHFFTLYTLILLYNTSAILTGFIKGDLIRFA